MLLIDRFVENFRLAHSEAKDRDPRLFAGMNLAIRAAREAEHVYLTEGSVAMLMQKLRNYQEVVQEVLSTFGQPHDTVESFLVGVSERATGNGFASGWIQFHKPITDDRDTIHAMLLYRPDRFLEVRQGYGYILFLIDGDGYLPYALQADDSMEWSFMPSLCTCRSCARERGRIVPCPFHEQFLLVWGRILSLSSLMVGQYLAERRYEEKVFGGIRRVPRAQSHKDRRVRSTHTFKVIDASEIIIPILSPALVEQKKEERDLKAGEETGSPLHSRAIWWNIRRLPPGPLPEPIAIPIAGVPNSLGRRSSLKRELRVSNLASRG